jgi:hypothetical protein
VLASDEQPPTSFRLADEAELALMLTDGHGAVLNQHRAKRIATRAQTLALIARDQGCSFPDCDRPPEWTQRHHITAWADGGPTNLDNLTLLCPHHHRSFEAPRLAVHRAKPIAALDPTTLDRPRRNPTTQPTNPTGVIDPHYNDSRPSGFPSEI